MPGFNDTQRIKGTEWTSTWAGQRELHHQLRRRSSKARTGTARNYGTTVLMTDASNVNNVGLASLPLLYPDGRIVDPNVLRLRGAVEIGLTVLPGRQHLAAAELRLGQPHRLRDHEQRRRRGTVPAEPHVPRRSQHQPDVGRVDQPHQGQGPPHDQGRVLPESQLQAAEHQPRARRAAVQGRDELLATTRTTRSTRGFGYANAALGILSSYTQQSKFVEGSYIYNNREWYVQDNWKVNSRLTLDYGLRFVNQQPQHDQFGHSANFFTDTWSIGNAPLLYLAGCPGGVSPCADDPPGDGSAERPTARSRFGDLHRSDRARHRAIRRRV